MKKMLVMAVAVAFSVAGFAGVASAKKCEFYQWKYTRCSEPKAQPVAAPAAPKIVKGEKLVLEGIYFDTGSAKIKKESYPVLDSNVEKVNNSSKDLKILIVGYTDNRGSEKLNQKLSDSRANSVKMYMEKKGVDAARISSVGRGMANPVADNNTDSGRAKNRRIELEAK